MNSRERFNATIKFQKIDRPFRWEAPGFWQATIKKWHNEGLPKNITSNDINNSRIYDYFKMDRIGLIPFNGDWITDPFSPMFERKIIKDEGNTQVIRDQDGIIKRVEKEDPDTSMPQFLEFPVKSKEDYEEKIKWRLNYESKERYPKEWGELIKKYNNRDYPLGLSVIGPLGHLRNLMGDFEMMLKFFDDPSMVHYIMKNWMNFYKEFIRLVCNDIVPDFIMIWEDSCYKAGPLISPVKFKEFMSPYLSEIITKAKAEGIEGIIIDSDGDVRLMIPIYLECGANVFFPFEVQAGMDIVQFRKEYGNSFAIMGGIDKRKLAANEEAVKEEIDMRVPFMLSQGGYIPMIDHSVPTDVSLNVFKFYIDYLRNVGVESTLEN